jgi:D-3-phosphoglycerate dehydrogenase
MKSTTYLISTSRGPVVDEPALIQALEQGWIQGAGIDVFEQEPVDPDNPILKMDNVVVSPHSLGHTDEYYKLAWSGKLRQAAQILRGEIPEALVNREVLEKPAFRAKFKKFQTP